MFDPKGNKMNMDKLLMDTKTATVWVPAPENELGRLSQGLNNRLNAQNTIMITYIVE